MERERRDDDNLGFFKRFLVSLNKISKVYYYLKKKNKVERLFLNIEKDQVRMKDTIEPSLSANLRVGLT